TFVAAAGSILSSFMSEAFPTKMRSAGIGFAYSLRVAVFGGSAPYLNAQFIQWDVYWMISAYIIALSVCTVIATAIMTETKRGDLPRVGQDHADDTPARRRVARLRHMTDPDVQTPDRPVDELLRPVLVGPRIAAATGEGPWTAFPAELIAGGKSNL